MQNSFIEFGKFALFLPWHEFPCYIFQTRTIICVVMVTTLVFHTGRLGLNLARTSTQRRRRRCLYTDISKWPILRIFSDRTLRTSLKVPRICHRFGNSLLSKLFGHPKVRNTMNQTFDAQSNCSLYCICVCISSVRIAKYNYLRIKVCIKPKFLLHYGEELLKL